MDDRLLELDEGEEQAFQRVFEVWIAAIAAVLMAEGMEANVAKQQAEKAVILVQGSLILSQGLNDVQVFKRIIGDLPTELLLG
jgi:TetR/AcrR family transcriptional repressor of lmrAB and yxaGH operons